MNVIDFFQELTTARNAVKQCGFCWSFGAPLSESGINASKSSAEEICCLNLFISFYKTQSSYTKNTATGLKNREWTDHSFILFAVKSANLGVNTYSEQPHHPIDESLWKTHLKPIQDCLGNGNELELCELGYPFEIIKWDMDVVQRFEDKNLTGWKITGIFRQQF